MFYIDYSRYEKSSIPNYKHIVYTYFHRKAMEYFINHNKYLSIGEKILLSNKAKIHDLDKTAMYLAGGDVATVHKIHRSLQKHHNTANDEASVIDKMETIFDYECAAATKPDKPLNAYDTILAYHPENMKYYKDILVYLHMNSSYIARSKNIEKYFRKLVSETTEKSIMKDLMDNKKDIVIIDILASIFDPNHWW